MTISRILLAALAVAALGSAPALAAPFELLVTQTPTGPDNANPATWGGVLAFNYTGNGAVATTATGIPASSLSDPAGLAFSLTNSTLYVGNRNGNNNPSAIINDFSHTLFGGFTASGTITGNSLNAIHQLAISPTTGELFAAGVNGPISRFTFSGATPSANGTINSGAARGVAVSPDGKRLYYTTSSNTIQQYDLTTNTLLSPITVPAATALHYLRFRNNSELYVADFNPGNTAASRVVSFTLNPDDSLTPLSSFTSANAIGIAFSPDGNELFVSGHISGVISQYLNVASAWTPAGTINTGTSLGDIIVLPTNVPEPTSLAVLGLSAAALLRRRR